MHFWSPRYTRPALAGGSGCPNLPRGGSLVTDAYVRANAATGERLA